MIAYRVYLDGRWIDTVFYLKSDRTTVEDVRNSLINHDGYSSAIVVRKERTR